MPVPTRLLALGVLATAGFLATTAPAFAQSDPPISHERHIFVHHININVCGNNIGATTSSVTVSCSNRH
ncbi:hypothetical protein [Nonomuraea sp. NPDC046570]|uniref:hypothetical protein n=1 Tax=Nonomuraea sp. NPDC046570 TaxID=3155255 RepID=UPI003401F631